MLTTLILILDLFTIVSGFVAAWLWYRAGQRPLRRVSRFETLDAADINRIVTNFNRAALLNRRAALATAVSFVFVALRFSASLLQQF